RCCTIDSLSDVHEMLKKLGRHITYTWLTVASSIAILSIVKQYRPIQAVPSVCSKTIPSGSVILRSNTPTLSSPRNPPSNMFLSSASLRLTHQVKLIRSLWNTLSRKSISPFPVMDLSRLYRCHADQACTGGLTSLKAHS